MRVIYILFTVSPEIVKKFHAHCSPPPYLFEDEEMYNTILLFFILLLKALNLKKIFDFYYLVLIIMRFSSSESFIFVGGEHNIWGDSGSKSESPSSICKRSWRIPSSVRAFRYVMLRTHPYDTQAHTEAKAKRLTPLFQLPLMCSS